MTALPAPTGFRSRFARLRNRASSLSVAALFAISATAILLFPVLPRNPYDLQVGDIAPEDIRAPREITYVSQLETQAARDEARAAVEDIYDPPDARVGRQQVRKARQIMAFVKDVRADPYADPDLKREYMRQIAALPGLPTETATALLNINDEQFAQVEGDVIKLVEEAMSGTVREGRERQVIDQLELKASPDLPEELIPFAVALARQLVVPNSFLNEEATEAARNDAAASVPDIRMRFQAGEVIVQAGEPLDALDREALEALGLTVAALTPQRALSAWLISVMAAAAIGTYLRAIHSSILDRPGHLALAALLFLLFLFGGQLMLPAQDTFAFLFPAAALAMALTALLGIEFGAAAAVVLALLGGYLAGGSLEITAYLGLSSTLAAARLRRAMRLQSFFRGGLYAALSGMAILVIFRFPRGVDPSQLGQVLAMAALNGLLSAGLALVILYVVGGLTNMTTSLQLIDLMRPDHPLQKKLQQEALGTYQHTLAVANLAEAAAEAIGANSLLVRVGTLYHDVGKTANPGFFIENRTEGGPDPHDQLNPLESARVIRAHVKDGLDLARRYRIPDSVTAFISEHHGTMPILFFLDKAQEQAEREGTELDESPYYYVGTPPRSRETAILMLADGSESSVRANRPATEAEIDAIVTRIIQQRIDWRQLDDSGLTLTELRTIKDSLVRTLKGMYHPRVKYPGDERLPELPGEVVPAVGDGTMVVEGRAASPDGPPSDLAGNPGDRT